jgi:hypothetical protein
MMEALPRNRPRTAGCSWGRDGNIGRITLGDDVGPSVIVLGVVSGVGAKLGSVVTENEEVVRPVARVMKPRNRTTLVMIRDLIVFFEQSEGDMRKLMRIDLEGRGESFNFGDASFP